MGIRAGLASLLISPPLLFIILVAADLSFLGTLCWTVVLSMILTGVAILIPSRKKVIYIQNK